MPIEESLDISLSTEVSAVTDVETLMERGQQRESTVEPSVWRADSCEIRDGLERAEARLATDETPAVAMMAVLGRPVLPGRAGALGRITLLHAGAAGFGVLTLIAVLALALSSSKDESPTTLDEPTAAQVAPPDSAADTSAMPAPDKPDPAVAASPVVPPPSTAMEHKCRPLAKYPAFPWKDKLATILTTAMASGVCGLFGRDTQSLSAQIGALAAAPATGYDLLPDGQVLEIFPTDPAVRPGPSLSLLFGAAGLLELRFDYGDKAGKELNAQALEALLGEPKQRVDEQGRKVEQFTDGDLIVEVLERRDKYRRVFRELRFSSRPLTEKLGKAGETRRKVEAMLAKGQEQRGERRFADAKKTFEKVLSLAPNLGQARVGLGMLALPAERFDEVEKQALASLEVSTDRRVQAEAKGLLAVVALSRGKGKDAWALFSEAAAMDPANGELLQSVRELETKTYAPERVAKTTARLRCLAKAKETAKKKKKRGRTAPPPWTETGLLARGNFPDRATYDKALASVSGKREFKSAEKLWSSWECR